MPIQIIQDNPKPKKPSFIDRLGNGANAAFQAGLGMYQKHEQEEKVNEAVRRLTNGKDVSGLPLESKMKFLEQFQHGENQRQSYLDQLQSKNNTKKQDQDMQLEKNRNLIRGIEEERGLESGSLDKFIHNPTLASNITKPQTPKAEKAPLGGLSGQPIDKEISQKIKQVMESSKGLNADELKLQMDESGIPTANSNAYVENRRRQDDRKADLEQRGKETNEKIKYEYHKESADYDKELAKNAKASKKQLIVIKDIDKALSSGKIGPTNIASVFKGLGTIGNKISNAVLNADEASLISNIPYLLEGWKEIFGVRLSDADLKLLEDKLPSIGRNVESNRAVLKIMKKYAGHNLLRQSVASEIREKNNGLRPLGFADKVEKRFDELTEEVPMINSKGQKMMVPAYQVGNAIKNGSRYDNE